MSNVTGILNFLHVLSFPSQQILQVVGNSYCTATCSICYYVGVFCIVGVVGVTIETFQIVELQGMQEYLFLSFSVGYLALLP